jgi:cation diffusion facilitator family transporter
VENRSPRDAASNLESGARLALYGVLINAVLAALKLAAGILGHSYALIADGIESALDVVSSAVMWGGLKVAARPPDATHPYGHGKAEPAAAIAGALTVIVAAVGLAVESIREIRMPHHSPAPFTLFVLVAVVIVKEALFRKVHALGEEAKSTAMRTDAWHHRSDAVTSFAAFLGISISLTGGPGFEAADDWAALFACGFIAWNGFRLLKPAFYEIMDTAPSPAVASQVRKIAAAVPGVIGIDQCRVRKMGLDYYVDIHVQVDGAMSVRDGHRIAHHVKDALRADETSVADVLVHIEPAARGATAPESSE